MLKIVAHALPATGIFVAMIGANGSENIMAIGGFALLMVVSMLLLWTQVGDLDRHFGGRDRGA